MFHCGRSRARVVSTGVQFTPIGADCKSNFRRPAKSAPKSNRAKEKKFCGRCCKWYNSAMRRLTLDGTTRTMAEWARHLGISRERLRQRIGQCERRRVDIREALMTPLGRRMPSFVQEPKLIRLLGSQKKVDELLDILPPNLFDGRVHHLTCTQLKRCRPAQPRRILERLAFQQGAKKVEFRWLAGDCLLRAVLPRARKP